VYATSSVGVVAAGFTVPIADSKCFTQTHSALVDHEEADQEVPMLNRRDGWKELLKLVDGEGIYILRIPASVFCCLLDAFQDLALGAGDRIHRPEAPPCELEHEGNRVQIVGPSSAVAIPTLDENVPPLL
jgi:hypothetical protein